MYTLTICLAVLVAAASAHVAAPHPRLERDITWDKQVGHGKVFGTLGNDESTLYGKAGYKQDIFKDETSRLTGEAYGSRVLSQYGDSSNFGGRLDYASKNAQAAVDISKQIGGRTSLQAEGNGVWKIDKDTDFSAGAMLRQEHLGHGRPDIGVQAKYEKRF